MAEKRFTYIDASKNRYIGSFFYKGNPLTTEEVNNTLNNLYEENEKLKLEIQQIKKDTDRIAIKLHKDCDEVYYENQKLKQEIQQLKNQELYQENKGLDITATNAIKALDVLNEENQKLKKVIQAIITKEFELSSDDNGYDPLSEFFNNEVPISQIDIEIDVENQK